MALRLRSASTLHNALPEEALRVIMLALPVDARARAACVCRYWRAFLADPSLWQVLDLTPAGGVVAERVTENLLRGAVARAAGHLRSLSINRVPDMRGSTFDLIVSDGSELQQISTDWFLAVPNLDRVFAATPRLQELNAPVSDGCTALLPVLRNDPPYGPLRVSGLEVDFEDNADVDALAFAAAVAAHESLTSLSLANAAFARGVNALVDAATERRISRLEVNDCALDAETFPALARLLQRGSLTKLELFNCDWFHNAEESVPELCAALRTCRTLTHLKFGLLQFNAASHRTVTELLDAAAALPALSVLDFYGGRVLDTAAFGRALGALLGVNLPSLRNLRVLVEQLGDEALAPLLDGLAANTHLRTLDCWHNDLSEVFKRDRLEPALAALAARAQLDE